MESLVLVFILLVAFGLAIEAALVAFRARK